MTAEEAAKPVEVLYVEDNPADADAVRQMLRGEDHGRFALRCVQRLEEAIELLQGKTFEVVLLDLSLPDSNGLEAFTTLHDRHPSQPIVILTGLDDESLSFAAFRQGAQDYLVKGEFDRRLLTTVLRYAIARKQIERERRESEEALRNFQKFEAIGRLAGGVAHDFNNLLTVINGRAELALDAPTLEDERHSVQEILDAGRRAATLVHQLLAFSRQQVLAPRSVDLNSLILDVLPLVRVLLGEDIEVRTELAPSLGVVKVDPAQFEQILMNLAANSRDAMPDGGVFTVRTVDAHVDEVRARLYKSVTAGPHVRMMVGDTGSGMDEATRARIFEPFFSTKKFGEGTGLGLATVYGIVKQSGGHIWVESEPGRGARFDIYLPHVASPRLEAPAAPSAVAAAGGKETVLLVEDEPSARSLFKAVLERYGYTVLEAENGETALERAEAHRASGTLDLLVTDLVMPRLSGRQVAERVRDLWPGVAVLYVSGYSREAVLQDGRLDPDSQFLGKPFGPEDLARKVRKVLESRHERARPAASR